MLSERLSGLLGSRYLPNLASEVPLVIEEFEDGMIVGIPRLFARHDGESVVGVPDDQIIREAAVQVPPGAGETIFYLFR